MAKDLETLLEDLIKALGPNKLQLIAAIGPILIVVLGGWVNHLYNKRQNKLQQLQTIEKFLPYLTSNNSDQAEFAVRMIAALGDPQLSSEIAKVGRSLGAAIAQLTILETGKAKEEEKRRAKESLEICLYYRVKDKDEGTVKRILKAGVSPNTVAPEGDVPLIMAVEKRQAAIVKLLLDHGAEPTSVDSSGRSALEFASTNGDVEIINHLIDALLAGMASMIAKTSRTQEAAIALLTILETGKPKEEEKRRAKESLEICLYYRVEEKDEETVKRILKAGVSPNTEVPEGDLRFAHFQSGS